MRSCALKPHADAAVDMCRVLWAQIVMGTSLVVNPFASLIGHVKCARTTVFSLVNFLSKSRIQIAFSASVQHGI